MEEERRKLVEKRREMVVVVEERRELVEKRHELV